MLRQFLFIYSLFFTLFVFAQKHQKWLELHGSFENTRFNSFEANEVFEERMGHSDGLNLQYFISDKTFLVSGLSLTSILYKTDLVNDLTIKSGAYAVHSSTFIFVPLMVGHEWSLGKRFNFSPRAGFQVGAPLREKTKYFAGDGSKSYESDYSLLLDHGIFKTNLELAFEFKATDNFRISLMPFATKRLSKESSSVVFRSRSSITYGLRGNLKIRL